MANHHIELPYTIGIGWMGELISLKHMQFIDMLTGFLTVASLEQALHTKASENN